MIAYITELIVSVGLFIAVRIPFIKVTAHLPQVDGDIQNRTFSLSIIDSLGDRSEILPILLTVLLALSALFAIVNMTSRAGKLMGTAGHIVFAVSTLTAIVCIAVGHTVLRTF